MKQCHPEQIGPYPITGILGHGGMGTVYRALVPGTGRIVALKLLNPSELLTETLGLEALREIFDTEAATMAGLRHPNIAEILDSGVEELGRSFYVMEHFCANLGMMIGEHYLVEETCRRIPANRAVAYGGQILAALQFIHSVGVIHRDIKPFNMLLSETDRIKICDFGMARRLQEKTFPVRGMHIGSPYYTAPEQLGNPEAADGRADLYAAGVMLYRMLTGELPAMKEFMLSRVDPLYDPAWDAFFARALSWRPDRRFQSAAEMSASLQRLELHRQPGRPDDLDRGSQPARTLRSSPLRITGDKAREAFSVNRLWQPLTPHCPGFAARDADTVLDKAANLVWQRRTPDQLVNLENASALVAGLNKISFSGIDSWRLPTVNELLSLARDPAHPHDDGRGRFFPDENDWFWSCDRRSAATSWYVNTTIGFAGWQDNGCRYSVRAVASHS